MYVPIVSGCGRTKKNESKQSISLNVLLRCAWLDGAKTTRRKTVRGFLGDHIHPSSRIRTSATQ